MIIMQGEDPGSNHIQISLGFVNSQRVASFQKVSCSNLSTTSFRLILKRHPP